MNGVIGIAGVVALLIVVGGLVGLAQRDRFAPRWLIAAAGLVILNDAMLTRAYGLLPRLLPDADWNWQGKLTALAATLVVATFPAFGWRRSGLTLRQARGSLTSSIPVALLYCLFFAILAYVYPSDPASRETVAFQLTMPGLEEEPFYRGILLLALDRTFLARWRFLGVDWGWGAVFSCAPFGLAHAFGYAHGAFSFDPLTMALTALPSFIAVWLRLRTGSVLLPILLHNFGNSISLFA
ncbi:CPBP family intramembrane glutamic endopeptidase, BDIM_20840 family [Sphingomonas nostoxanthinifaciens]|uniref:CPBP family intramembrane glutamic endopeptidase, BDIM_20840 family n=1 Tax=Sphingomonas nostoxanthinifaciens TaxID=2872652 RepID=UPI001CC1DC18|nr:CPBP family intramembrane glutamic endopeptidase [Sphingomonas nostoxanthinifaciens]UAK23070.1 CPBP family intramembrane metalloprotease [Sphingomonas nostoxanthinifaciens]